MEQTHKPQEDKEDIILQNFEVGFTSEDYDTSILDEGEDEIFIENKMIITLSTLKNQKDQTNIDNNITTIDLLQCEKLLRNEYKLFNNETLYIKKIDAMEKGMKIPKVEYDIYAKLKMNNLTK